MYEFHYDTLQSYFGEQNLQLHYMDTDSFFLSIDTPNLKVDLIGIGDHFDFSNLDKDDELFSNKNKKVIGKFKIETGSDRITEAVFLRSKMYSYKTDKEVCSKLKGINKSVTKNIKEEDYKNTLFNGETTNHLNHSIRSIKHQIYVVEQNKKGLDSRDDKRYYINNKESVPYGFYSNRAGIHSSVDENFSIKAGIIF